ncbi:hypothetical protein L484_008886 [Morus notabilis]|uniref:Uncharacterized protein n=1 Tax=Morus notabilis TaxID=981085 RepID=W9R7C0_9ROSA|nr:hypothetical protein L484_008886 [Morus notabilis]
MDFGGNHSNGGPASTTLNRDDAKDVLFNMKQPRRLTKLCANPVRHTPDDENSFNSSYSTDSFFIPDPDDCSLVIDRNLNITERPRRKGDEKRLPHVRENSLEKNTIIRAVSSDNPTNFKHKQKSSSSKNKRKRCNKRSSLSEQELGALPERTLGSSPKRTLRSIPELLVGVDFDSDFDLNHLQSRLPHSDLEKIQTTYYILSNVKL